MVFVNFEKGLILLVEFLFGNFILNENIEVFVILIVIGMGFVFIKLIVEYQIREGGLCLLYLYWGVNIEVDIYLCLFFEMWVEKYDWFMFMFVFFDFLDVWNGCIGFVYKVV